MYQVGVKIQSLTDDFLCVQTIQIIFNTFAVYTETELSESGRDKHTPIKAWLWYERSEL